MPRPTKKINGASNEREITTARGNRDRLGLFLCKAAPDNPRLNAILGSETWKCEELNKEITNVDEREREM